MDCEEVVQNFFSNIGYTIEKIEEGNQKTPDFFITDGVTNIILELKSKYPSDESIEIRENKLFSGIVFNENHTISYNNTKAGIIRKAEKQIEEYSPKSEIFRVIWIMSFGYSSEPSMYEFETTLYGKQAVISENGGNDAYFFNYSEFYKFRDELDAALVSNENGIMLLLNPLSPRYNELKKNPLVIRFGDAVIDPIDLEGKGEAFIVDFDGDRSNKKEILNYLMEKYKIKYLNTMEMHFLTGTIRINRDSKSKIN